ncbi:MAG TPA: nucleoside triphosphate pyrophosphohydrolase [Chthoniobacteraceae bacterium]|jgi:MazG family protein|nr:nucleoside triphosphate pyrophosphohydrolase [Chthoniobacteraceae bacterium]
MDTTTRPTPPDPRLPPLDQLRDVVAKLRGPGGCPWDREQTHATLRGGLLEEAYEVVAAIDAGDDANLREELGDLLLQVIFHSQLAAEDGRFQFDDVAREIAGKLVRRHPHVFGAESAETSAAVLVKWDEIKRAEKGGAAAAASLLDGLPVGLPALLHAHKVQKKAAKVGFDWPDAPPIMAKVREEIAELEEAIAGGSAAEIEGELGDLLFSVVNLARHLHVEAEVALSGSTEKFSARFRDLEGLARERGLELEKMTLGEMDVLWEEVKQARKG